MKLGPCHPRILGSLKQSPHISGSDTRLADLVKFFIRSPSEKFCHLYPKWYYNGTFNMKTNINKILVLSHKIKSTHHSTPILWIYLWSSLCPWPWCGIGAMTLHPQSTVTGACLIYCLSPSHFSLFRIKSIVKESKTETQTFLFRWKLIMSSYSPDVFGAMFLPSSSAVSSSNVGDYFFWYRILAARSRGGAGGDQPPTCGHRCTFKYINFEVLFYVDNILFYVLDKMLGHCCWHHGLDT